MAITHREIFERYVYAGAITRNPDAIAAMFTEDGVLDAPLAPTATRCTGAWSAARRSAAESVCITSSRRTRAR